MSITRDVNRVRLGLESIELEGISGVPMTNYSASGAIDLDGGDGLITKAGVAAMTLAQPTATTEDFKKLTFVSTTAQAHTITTATNGINGNKHIDTFANIGDRVTYVAFNGTWFRDASSTTVLS